MFSSVLSVSVDTFTICLWIPNLSSKQLFELSMSNLVLKPWTVSLTFFVVFRKPFPILLWIVPCRLGSSGESLVTSTVISCQFSDILVSEKQQKWCRTVLQYSISFTFRSTRSSVFSRMEQLSITVGDLNTSFSMSTSRIESRNFSKSVWRPLKVSKISGFLAVSEGLQVSCQSGGLVIKVDTDGVFLSRFLDRRFFPKALQM